MQSTLNISAVTRVVYSSNTKNCNRNGYRKKIKEKRSILAGSKTCIILLYRSPQTGRKRYAVRVGGSTGVRDGGVDCRTRSPSHADQQQTRTKGTNMCIHNIERIYIIFTLDKNLQIDQPTVIIDGENGYGIYTGNKKKRNMLRSKAQKKTPRSSRKCATVLLFTSCTYHIYYNEFRTRAPPNDVFFVIIFFTKHLQLREINSLAQMTDNQTYAALDETR